MAITLRLEGVHPSTLTVGTSPLAELMASLHVLSELDHHPHQARWAQGVSAAMRPGFLGRFRTLSPLWARFRCRLMLPLQAPLGRPLDWELARLDGLPGDLFARMVVQAIVGSDFEGLEGSLDSPELQKTVIREAGRRSMVREELAVRLFRDPHDLRADLLSFIDECRRTFFDAFWASVEGRVLDASAELSQQLQRRPLTEVIASLGVVAQEQRESQTVTFDKLQHADIDLSERACLIVPTVQGFPHLLVKSEAPWPVVIHAPLTADKELGRNRLSLVTARLQVLGEPRRLDICRHLVNEPITTTRIAERTGMSAAQVSRHIARLKEVGLVTSERDGQRVFHRLVTERVTNLGFDLLSSIVR